MSEDLVLIPGHLCDQRMWLHQKEHLAGITRIHIANTVMDDSVSGIAQRLLADAPARFAMAGFSMGGYVAMEVMRQAPERVERLALMDTTGFADPPERRATRELLLDMAQKGDLDQAVGTFVDLLFNPDLETPQTVRDATYEMMYDLAQSVLSAQIHLIMNRPDSRPDMPGYKCPTLVLCGRQDILTPLSAHEEMAGLIPNAELQVVEDCAHMSTMEQPDTVTELMRAWLNRAPAE